MRIQILTSLAQDCNFVEDWLHLSNRNKFHCARFAQSLHQIGCTSAIETSFIALGLHNLCTRYKFW